MSDEDIRENILRDLCAVSNFGDLETLLADFHALNSSQGGQSGLPPALPTPKNNRKRNKRKCIIGPPDDDRPSTSTGRGRGMALEQMEGVIHGYEFPHELNRGLKEIGSGNFRNEMIEAFIDDEQQDLIRRQYEDSLLLDLSDDYCSADDVADDQAVSPSREPSSPSPAPIETPPAVKSKKSKKNRNVVLLSILAKSTNHVVVDGKDSVKLAMDESGSQGPSDEDTSSDAFVLSGNLQFLQISDSLTGSEVEVESQESYLMDDGLANDGSTSNDLQTSVETLTDLSSSPSQSPSSKSGSKKSRSSSKSSGSYHGTSRRKRMVPMPQLPPQNPALGRRSPSDNVYVPKIVDTRFSLDKREFPPL